MNYLENVTCLGHSTIKIKNNEQIIYFDPYNINKEYHDASVIFITHMHYDHFSEEDILKVKKKDTIIVVPEIIVPFVLELGFSSSAIFSVQPSRHYEVAGIHFSTILAYNVDKPFHSKDKKWVGYLISVSGVKYYIAGDTDITLENKKVKCDVAFVPVDGKFNMNSMEASQLINTIKPKVAVPIHYGVVAGSIEDAENFRDNIDEDIRCEIMY